MGEEVSQGNQMIDEAISHLIETIFVYKHECASALWDRCKMERQKLNHELINTYTDIELNDLEKRFNEYGFPSLIQLVKEQEDKEIFMDYFSPLRSYETA